MSANKDKSPCITALKDEVKVHWTTSKCILDHVQILLHFHYFFIAPIFLTPRQAEASNLSQNFVNSCPYCRLLHIELGRMAGLHEAEKINDVGQVHPDDVEEVRNFAMFGSSFGSTKGANSKELDEIHDEIEAKHSRLVARATRGLSFFLLWGSMSGNTINKFLFETIGKFKIGYNALFELIFVIYYGPLFIIISSGKIVFHYTYGNKKGRQEGRLVALFAIWVVLPSFERGFQRREVIMRILYKLRAVINSIDIEF
eukprot:scaffold3835_cov295-Chaetoceros_neogracile.AAC.3